jgi:hypothetical protein
MSNQPNSHRPPPTAELKTSLDRRAFFRGLGACIALPMFESALARAPGSAAAKAVPTRMAFVYVPNGTIPSAWWPEGDGGSDFALSRTLEPLADVRHQLSVIAGLQDIPADEGLDGAGDHARAGGTFLTGVRIKKTAGADIHAGVSIDQIVASRIGHMTRFASLELTCDDVRKSGNCDSGYACAYEYNLAWRTPNQPLTPEHSPRLVFERLFGAGSPAERVANLRRRQREQDARGLTRQLDGRDRQKLDQYLTSVRDIEKRIENSERLPVANPDVEAPVGVPASYEEHIALMFDMLQLAFQTDSTRVATVLVAREGSNRNFTEIGISEGHHNLTHHRNNPGMIDKVKVIDHWYVQQLARFLRNMDQTKEIDGKSLLHHSMIVYGSGNADGNRHTHVNLPILLAGAGSGAFKPGRYVKTSATPVTNLFLSMADAMGAPGIESHGDSTGRLGALA